MNDISGNITITVISEKEFSIQILGNFNDINISNPKIYSSGDLVGKSLLNNDTNTYSIHYNECNFGLIDIVIEPFSVLLDKKNTNFNSITESFIKHLPTIKYNIPNPLTPINFSEGLSLQIEISGCFCSGMIPLDIVTSGNLTLKSRNNSSGIFFQNNQLYFVTSEECSHYNEYIILLPEPNIQSLGETITLTPDNSNITELSPQIGVSVFTVINNVTPLSVVNLPTNFETTNVNTDFYKLVVSTLDPEPTFTLNNYNMYFSINSSGIISKIDSTPLGTYILDITINDSFNQSIQVFFQVTIVDILSKQIIINKVCDNKYNNFSVSLNIFCPEEEKYSLILSNNSYSFTPVINALTNILKLLFRIKINPNFNISVNDNIDFLQVFVNNSKIDYLDLLRSKFPGLVINSNLDKKLQYYTNISYKFYKDIISSYLNLNNKQYKFVLYESDYMYFNMEFIRN